MAPRRGLDRAGLALALLCCLSWGIQQVAVKLALPEIPPFHQATLRSLGATLLVGAWAWRREPKLFARDGSLRAGLFCGLLFGAEFVALFLALPRTSAGHVGLFLYTAPFFVALGAAALLPGERLDRRQWGGLAACFGGVALALASGRPGDGTSLAGDALALLAGAFWGGTVLTIRATALARIPAVKTLLYEAAVSVPVLALGALVAGERLAAWPGPVAAASLAYQVVWIGSVTFALWIWLLGRYRAPELSAFTFLTPVLGAFAAALILGEPLSPLFLVAVALVALGIVVVNWPRRG